jgi:hypothetical protein
MKSFVCLYRCGTICLDYMAAKKSRWKTSRTFLALRVFFHIKFLVIPHHRHYGVRELQIVTSAGHVTRTEELKHVQLHFS